MAPTMGYAIMAAWFLIRLDLYVSAAKIRISKRNTKSINPKLGSGPNLGLGVGGKSINFHAEMQHFTKNVDKCVEISARAWKRAWKLG